MTERELQEKIDEITPEKLDAYYRRYEDLLELDPQKGSEEYEELIDLYLIIETWEEIQFRLEYVHIKEMKKLMWSYTAILTAIFSVLFAVFMKK